MKKTIFSTVTLLLLLQGCGSSSNSNEDSKASTEVSTEVKSFASGFKDSKSIGKSVGKSTSSASASLASSNSNKQVKYQKETLESCTNGGTVKITGDTDFENMSETEALNVLQNGFSITVDYDKCIEDGEKIDASMGMLLKLKNELMTMNLKFNKDSTFEDLESTEIVTISKDSKMNIEEISDNEEKITESMNFSSSKGKRYETIELISHEISTATTESFYEVSGQRINNGITYRVDENYDASKTPMVFENYEDLLSGTAKYFNAKNEHITVKVVGKNQIKISVDSDNDGTDDAEEVISL